MNLSRFLRRAISSWLQQKPDFWLAPFVFRIAKALIADRGTSTYLRRIIDFSCPSNPLEDSDDLPEIQIHVVATRKDFELLPLVFSSVSKHCLNPIGGAVVIVPDDEKELVRQLPIGAEIKGESTVLPKSFFSAIDSHHPENRRGWILQQALKLWSARNSSAPGVLVLDADTLLTKDRVFLNSKGRQILCYSHEYHVPYEAHASQIWGDRQRDIGLSYVCHHQLMQPDVLKQMFPEGKHLVNWILAADITERSPIADYHSYGRWLVDHYPSRVAPARWGNQSVSIERDGSTEERQVAEYLRALSKEVYSISFHHYLHDNGQSSSTTNFRF